MSLSLPLVSNYWQNYTQCIINAYCHTKRQYMPKTEQYRTQEKTLFTPGVSDHPGPLASSLINKKSPEPRINTPLSVSPMRPTPAQHKT